MTAHEKLEHSETNVLRHECDFGYCKNSFKHKKEYEDHLVKDHPGEKLPDLICQKCGKTFDFFLTNKFQHHMRSHKNQEENEASKEKDLKKPEKLPCEKCGNILGSALSLKLHLAKHLQASQPFNYLLPIVEK